jgi:hypothetical protein
VILIHFPEYQSWWILSTCKPRGEIASVLSGSGAEKVNRTAEASRAIRKKLKHGNAHHQLRALVVRAFTNSMQLKILMTVFSRS